MNQALPDLMSAIGWTLVHFLWQGALIGFATAVALTALRNARPQLRYMVACAGLLACLAWPALDLCAQLSSPDASGDAAQTAARLVIAGATRAAPDMLAWLQDHMQLLVSAWAACAMALALRMMAGLLWLGRVGRSPLTDGRWQACIDRLAGQAGIGRAVRLHVVTSLASPITAGWWRPVVLVPAALVSGMPPDLLEALLAHEIAHIKRHDYLVNLAQNVVESLLFYHPAVWWISGRIRAEREQIADDLASRQLGEPRRLALALSELEKLQFSSPRLAQAANGGDLLVRIRRLVRPDAQALSWKAALPVLGLALACLSACSNLARDGGADTSANTSRLATQAPVPAAPAQPPMATAAADTAPARVAQAAQKKLASAAPLANARPTAEIATGSAAEPQMTSTTIPSTRALAQFASCEKPRWPTADLEAGHEGTVTLAFLVGADGRVSDSRVVRSSGYRAMDEQALVSIAKCSFKPATVEGKPVQAWTMMQYVWTQH